MAYTAIDKSTDHFETILYSGNNTTNTAITGLDFEPDWVWIKSRSAAASSALFNSVIGVTYHQVTNANSTQAGDGSYFKSFNSNGFTIGTGGQVNDSGVTYISWNWKAGTSFSNDASSTGVGTIDSSGSVNDTAGISICKWVGTGSNGTVKHGLTTKPQVILQKNTGYAYDWYTWHDGIPINQYLKLNTQGSATSSDSGGVTFGNTDPTTSVFSLGNDGGSNRSGDTHLAYIFSERKGFSKFGSYTGNGNADGTYVDLGFRPAWVMTKRSNNSENWYIIDNKRSPFNPPLNASYANLNYAEDTNATGRIQDFLSNGFKLRTSDTAVNGNGDTYVYYAFAENPFVTSTGIPVTAR